MRLSNLFQQLLLLLFLSAVMVGTFVLLRWQLTPLLRELRGDDAAVQDRTATPQNVYTLTVTLPPLTRAVVATVPSTGTRTVPTPKLLPTPAATHVVGIVNSEVVNVRSYPSLAGEVVGQVKGGDRLEILATSPDGQWLQVCCPLGTRAGDSQSWVAADLVSIQP